MKKSERANASMLSVRFTHFISQGHCRSRAPNDLERSQGFYRDQPTFPGAGQWSDHRSRIVSTSRYKMGESGNDSKQGRVRYAKFDLEQGTIRNEEVD